MLSEKLFGEMSPELLPAAAADRGHREQLWEPHGGSNLHPCTDTHGAMSSKPPSDTREESPQLSQHHIVSVRRGVCTSF